jgi:hypothetical protein
MGIVADVSVLPERVKRELIRGENARAEFAIRAQTALKEAMNQMGPVRFINGIGRKVATIHPEMAARLRVKFGASCLTDPKFLAALVRDNPFLKATCVPDKVTIRVDGLKSKIAVTQPAERARPGFQNRDSKISEGNPQSSQITQNNGDEHGARRDPATPSNGSHDRGSVLCFTPGPRSGHETVPAPGNLRQSANSADPISQFQQEGTEVTERKSNSKTLLSPFAPVKPNNRAEVSA